MSEDETREEIESRIDRWVRYGLSMVIRRIALSRLRIPLGASCDDVVQAMADTIRVADELPNDNALGTLYQRAMEVVHHPAAPTSLFAASASIGRVDHVGGFDLERVPYVLLPGVDFLSEPWGATNAMRNFNRDFIADIDDATWEALGALGDPAEDDDIDVIETRIEATDDMERDAIVIVPEGVAYRFYISEGLFLVPEHMEWSEREDQYEMPHGAMECPLARIKDDRVSPCAFGRAIAEIAFGIPTASAFVEEAKDGRTPFAEFLLNTRLGEMVSKFGATPFRIWNEDTAAGNEILWQGDPYTRIPAPMEIFRGRKKR